MIIGTAGHIDHGKTALIKALTGIDADRLAEEKRRGITIDLGYAYCESPDGSMLGFIDVPGHEKFVHNMLAGATGIDCALLVIAADDGVMPQTREHLAVLELLGLRLGAVVISKIDRVDALQLGALDADLERLLAGTFLANAPRFQVCSPSGVGIAELKRHLQQLGPVARSTPVDQSIDSGFRMAIDRVFTLTGVGTVVTGTIHSGQISTGASVRLAPRGLELKVRGLHAQNRVAAIAQRGERCAINLSGDGLERSAIQRGDWLTAPWLHRASSRFDARLRTLADLRTPLKSWLPAHLHMGAADVMCRILPLSPTEVAAGQEAWVQVVCEVEIHVCVGDRFVLRNQGANQTLGGGVVVDIAAPQRKRRTGQRLAQLQALALEANEDRLLAVVGQSDAALSLLPIAAQWNVPQERLRAFAQAQTEFVCKSLSAPGSSAPGSSAPGSSAASSSAPGTSARGADSWLVWHRDCWTRLCEKLLSALKEFHLQFPDELGCERDRLRRIAAPEMERGAARVLIQSLIEQGDILASGVWLHAPQHQVTLSPGESQFRDQALLLLNQTPLDPPWVRDIARLTSLDEKSVRGYLLRLMRQGEVHQIVRDLFFTRSAVERMTACAGALQSTEGAITAARFRDQSGLSRKRAIQVLEYFDRVGIARRVRDVHFVREQHLVV